MEQQERKDRRYDRILWGCLLIAIGAGLFATRMGIVMPDLFSVPTLLIVIGLIIGIKHKFQHPGWLIPLLIGVYLGWDKWFPAIQIKQFILPGALILIGAFVMLRPKSSRYRRRHRDFHNQWENTSSPVTNENNLNVDNKTNAEFIDSINFFSGTKKKVISKNFTGGDITCFMGGGEIDLSQADIEKPVIIDLTLIFGGMKLIIPSHWDVKSEMISVFGGVSDKRNIQNTEVNFNKSIILSGTAVFGGVEISNY